MEKIILALFFIIPVAVFSQTLKILSKEGSVFYAAPNNKITIEVGQQIIDNSIILLGDHSQLVYRNGQKYAAIKKKGQYSTAQLLKILNSNEGDFLSRYIHYLYEEMIHRPNVPQFDKNAGTERGFLAQILCAKRPSIYIADTVVDFINALRINDSSLFTTVEIVPVTTKNSNGREVADNELTITDLLDDSGNIVIRTEQPIIFKVKNVSNQPVYFSLLDIQPDKNINAMILADTTNLEKYRIEPGHLWESPVIRCQPPLGTEVWKLIATKQPFDIRFFINTCEAFLKQPPTQDTFESFYAESLLFKSASGRMPDSKIKLPGQLFVYSIAFKINK